VKKTAKWRQAGSRDRGVHFCWPHEGRNYHIHDIVGPPTWFKKNESPHTKKVLHWLLSYWAVYRHFSAAGGTDCIRHSSDPPPWHVILGGKETTGKIHQIEVTSDYLYYFHVSQWNGDSSRKI